MISRQALAEGWPIVATTLVVGTAFGIAARQAGLEPIVASGMSVILFAGASQFAAVDLLARNASPVLVVLTVLLLNLRHLLMAAAMRAQLARRPLLSRLGAAYLLTDESFAMAIAHERRGGRDLAYYVTFAAAMWLGWNTGTLLGATVVSDAIDPRTFGLDFAITAAFMAIVVLGIRDRTDVAVALIAAFLAGVLRLAGAPAVAVVIAGAVAPLAAAFRSGR